MTCDQVQVSILELGPEDSFVSAHLAGCENCRRFLTLQGSLDEQLARAYIAPAPGPNLRASIRSAVRAEKRKRVIQVTTAWVAPAGALVAGGIGALYDPQRAQLLLAAGLGLSALSYAGELLFTWLIEELGES